MWYKCFYLRWTHQEAHLTDHLTSGFSKCLQQLSLYSSDSGRQQNSRLKKGIWYFVGTSLFALAPAMNTHTHTHNTRYYTPAVSDLTCSQHYWLAVSTGKRWLYTWLMITSSLVCSWSFDEVLSVISERLIQKSDRLTERQTDDRPTNRSTDR